MNTTRRLAVVGAGSVGATIAYAAMIRGVARHIVLYDIDRTKAEAQSLDLAHGLQFVPECSVTGSGDLEIIRNSDVIVITAGAKQRPGQTRLQLANSNVAMLKSLAPKLVERSPNAIFVLVSNPVDVLTWVFQKITGLPSGRVIGTGTILDSSRFRWLIAQRLKIAVGNVHALIVGEHGDSCVPLWSSASAGSVPLHDWAVMGHGKLSVRDRTDIFVNVKTAAQQIIEGKGATNFAIGLACAELLEAIFNDEKRVLPISTLISNREGINDVCLSLPTIVGAKGAEVNLDVPMNENETAGLKRSAEILRDSIKATGL